MSEPTEVTTLGSTVDEWTRALAESSGSPGGGAGAGVMLAIAASLTSMAAGYTRPAADEKAVVESVVERARSLRALALRLADDDSTASRAFGAAFHLDEGPEREEAIGAASIDAAHTSAELGRRAIEAIDDLVWLAEHGDPALIADVVVALGALRATLTGARTNVSFDLASARKSGLSLEDIRAQHPRLWGAVDAFDTAIARIDDQTGAIIDRGLLPDTP